MWASVALAFLAASAFGCRATSPAPTTRPIDLTKGVIEYGDLLCVRLIETMDRGLIHRRVTRVNEKGCLSAPLVGEIAVSGLTLDEAAKAVREAYRDVDMMMPTRFEVIRLESGRSPSIALGPFRPGEYASVKMYAPDGLMMVFSKQVDAEGCIEIPRAGRVFIAGATEAEAYERIRQAMPKRNLSFSDICKIGADAAKALATTQAAEFDDM